MITEKDKNLADDVILVNPEDTLGYFIALHVVVSCNSYDYKYKTELSNYLQEIIAILRDSKRTKKNLEILISKLPRCLTLLGIREDYLIASGHLKLCPNSELNAFVD